MTDKNRLDADKDKDKNMSRRDILGKASVGAFIGAAGVCVAGLVRAVMPQALPDPSQKFKIGPAQDYPSGTVRNFDDENVIVFRDDEGMYAISTVCTHLECIVTRSDDGEFECPCHGSKFHADGKVAKGPAPTPLPWLEVSKLPSGQLAVDASKKVPLGTKTVV